MKPPWKGWGGALLWLAALGALAYGSCLIGGRTILLRDLFTQFQGPRWWYAQSLHAGAIPYWNPYVGCGIPFAANPQNAVFYPFTLLFAALPFGPALAWYAALHIVLLGFCCYLLARTLGLSFWGALLAGTVAAFAGIPTKQIEFPEMLGGFAWTPLVLLAGWKCLGRPSARWTGLLGAAFGLQLLAGSPYPPLYSLLGLGAAIAAARLGRLPLGGRSLGGLGAGLGLGALIGCVQYVPTFLLARGLPAEKLTGVMQSRFSLRLRDLVDFVGPWMAGFPNWQKCFYVGIVALGCAALALRRPSAAAGRDPRARWWFAVLLLLLGLLFAQGGYLGTDRWIDHLPLVRRAGKWPTLALSLDVLALALLAGEGLERWLGARRPSGAGRWAAWLAPLAGFAALFAIDAALGAPLLGRLRAALEEPMLAFLPPAVASPPPLAPEELRLAALAGAAALLAGLGLAGRLRGLAGPAVCLLAAAELLSAGRGLNFRSPADVYAEPAPASVGALLGPGYAQGNARILVPASFANLGDAAYGSEEPERFRTLRRLYLQDTAMSWRVFTTQSAGSVPLPDYQQRLEPVLDALAAEGSPRALQVLGAWNVTALLRGGLAAGGLAMERNPYSQGRAWLAEGHFDVDSPEAALAALAAGRGAGRSALTLRSDELPIEPEGTGAAGAVEAIDYLPNEIRVRCTAARAGLLVLAENWAPGWSAAADGAPARDLRVNFLQQGVWLAPGRHQVAFRYRAPGSAAGFALAALGLAGIACCGLVRGRK